MSTLQNSSLQRSQMSDFSSEQDYDDIPSLTNKEILQLIQIDRMIRKQEKILKYSQQKTCKSVQQPIPGKLFISNLPFGYDKHTLVNQIRRIFKPFGKLKQVEVKIKNNSSIFGFVTYQQLKSSKKALQYLKGTLVFGRKIFINEKYETYRNYDRTESLKIKKQKRCTSPIVKVQHKQQEQETYSNTQQAQGQKQGKLLKLQQDFIFQRTQQQKAKIEEYIKQKQPNKRIVRTRQLKF